MSARSGRVLSARSGDAVKDSKACPKCGSSDIIPRVDIYDKSFPGTSGIHVRVHNVPMAILASGTILSALKAAVCGSCGHAEMYVEEPAELYEAYLEALQNQPPDPSEYGAETTDSSSRVSKTVRCLECEMLMSPHETQCPSCGWTYEKT